MQIDVKGEHPTLGLQLQKCPNSGRMQLQDMAVGTPGIRIPKWRSTLRRAILLTFNNTPITDVGTLRNAVAQARSAGQLKATCEFATISMHPIHPNEGSLHLYYDQLNVIAQHLQLPTVRTIQTDWHPTRSAHDTTGNMMTVLPSEQGKSFTWKEIKKRGDIREWQHSRYKMLDDYMNQSMFSDPMPKPKGANVHHMLWRY